MNAKFLSHIIFIKDSKDEGRKLGRVTVGKKLLVNLYESLQSIKSQFVVNVRHFVRHCQTNLFREKTVGTVLEESLVPLPNLLLRN